MTSSRPAGPESRPDAEFEPDRVVIRDNRKIDRDAAHADGAAGAAPSAGLGEVPEASPSSGEDVSNAQELLLEERTRDLQRVSAEYANYRKRADREHQAAGDLATGRALAELLPVVDDLDRARAHGDLSGALKAVADKLDASFAKLGLVSFGEVGDPFDPSVHEAVMHDESDDVAAPTCTTVLRPGYKHRDRLLRPAMVGVTDPSHPAATTTADNGQAAGQSLGSEGGESSPSAAPPENASADPDSPATSTG